MTHTGLYKKIYLPIGAAVIFGCVLMLQGCAGEKNAKKDQFFEKWETMANTSEGHSPPQKKRAINISEAISDEKIKIEGKVAAPAKPLPTNLVTLKMRQADIKAVLRSLARAAGYNIVVRDDIKKEITVDFKEVPWDQAFMSILQSHFLSYTWEGDIIRVLTIEDMEYNLKVSAITDKKATQEMAIKQAESLKTMVVNINYADAKALKENLLEFITKGKEGKLTRGFIKVDEHTNSLIIQAIQEDLNTILPVINSIDRPTPQILIKANIVETSKETARNLGVQWGGMYHGDNRWFATPGGTGGTTGTNPVTTSGAYTPLSGKAGISGQGFGVNFPAEAATGTGAASLGLMFGTIGGNILDLQLSALQKDGKLNILSSPSITTLDNQKASTENGEKVPFVTTQASGGTATQTVSFEQAVLKLEITPHVIDGKNLKMEILVQKDEVDMTRQVQGNPFIIKKQTKTNLIVQDGETIVISGLTKHRTINSDSGIPGLKDIPLLGWLFKSDSKQDKMEEVLIFITPHMLPPQVTEAVQSGQETSPELQKK